MDNVDYYPFGWVMPGRNASMDEYRYAYQGSEKDDEVKNNTGTQYTTFYRGLDPRIGRWLSVDPKATAWESPYTSMGYNPVWYNDPFGDTLDIGGNKKQSKVDVKSLAKDENQKYIKFKRNRVVLKFDKLNDEEIENLLTEDEGLNLINDLVASDKNILYEASNVALIRDVNGNKTHGVLSLTPNLFGVINASEGGFDSNFGHRDKPREGYDGQVVISPKAIFREKNAQGVVIQKSRASIVFHELAENYARTHGCRDYYSKNGGFGAHEIAQMREHRWHGKSNMPGQSGKPQFIPANSRDYKRYRKKIDEYHNR